MHALIRKLSFVFLTLLLISLIQSKLFGQITNITKSDGLTSYIVTCTHVDSKGIVWIGTTDGLNAYSGSKLYAIASIEDSQTGKTEALGRIETIFEDSNGHIWVSVMNKIFLYRGNYWTVFSETEIDEYVAKDFYEDSRGWIWVMLEHFKDFSDIPELKFSFLGGTLEMYDGMNWYKFDEDVAGTAAYSGQGIPRYYTNMLQDKEGNIWLGSLEGVYKFDGIDWTHFDKSDIISEKVLKLMIDKNQVLWAATEYGISYKKGDEWIDLSKKDGLCGDAVYDIIEDPKGRIWAFLRNNLRYAGINLIEKGNAIAFDKNKLKLKGTVEKLVWQQGKMMAFSQKGVSYYNDNEKWVRFGKDDGLSDVKFTELLKDKQGALWLAGESSLYRFDENEWKHLNKPENWIVKEMIMDAKGILWMGTEKKGVFSYQDGKWHRYDLDNGLLDNEVIKMFEDANSNIWIVTKKGLSIISGN